MTAEKLRDRAQHHRLAAEIASQNHVEAAKRLATKLASAERIALEAEAGVYDCMARRNRQWAEHLEAAANEVDESA